MNQNIVQVRNRIQIPIIDIVPSQINASVILPIAFGQLNFGTCHVHAVYATTTDAINQLSTRAPDASTTGTTGVNDTSGVVVDVAVAVTAEPEIVSGNGTIVELVAVVFPVEVVVGFIVAPVVVATLILGGGS